MHVKKDSSRSRTAPTFSSTRRDVLKAIGGGLFVAASGCSRSAEIEPVSIAVVGAGLFGSSTAMHLASSGAGSVLLIGPSEVEGGTSAAQALASHYDESRNATAMDADPEWAELARSSVEPMRALENRSGMKVFHEVGSLRVTQGRFAQGYFNIDGIRNTASKLAIPLVSLTPQSLAARYPECHFDSDSLGLLQERDAGVIRPRSLVSAMRKVAVLDGATWLDDEVTRIEPETDYVSLLLASGTRLRAQRVVVATGAAPIGHALLPDEPAGKFAVHGNLAVHIEVPDSFKTTLSPTMLTSSSADEFFGGFIAPPMRYPDGRRYVKVAGQVRSLADGAPVPDQVDGAVRAAKRLFPSLTPGSVRSQVCMTTDTESGRPVIDWVDSKIAVAIAGNGKGAKAALEIGRRAAARCEA